MEYDVIIARYGELGIKSPRVRRRFENKLVSNIKSSFECEIKVIQGRVFIKPANYDEALDKLAKVFGIVSFSPAITTITDFDKIAEDMEIYVDKLESDGLISSKTPFAIRSRRVGEHDFSSQELGAFAGSVVVGKIGAPVDLTNPQMEIFVETRQDETFIYHQKIAGPGGLPVGTQGKLIVLLSGGIDSPVAAYMMMKRGCQITALHFDNEPFTDPKALDKVQKIVEKLREYSTGVKLTLKVVKYGQYLQKCSDEAEKLTCVLCKSGMYQTAEMVANKENALGIVDGSSVGQVASQTLPNLLATRNSVSMPVLSPLIGMDKVEIENMAKKIGTYEISIIQDGGCSAVPRYPETNADMERLIDAQEAIGVDNELKLVIDSLKTV
ncbi:MAG: tRNA uracil 4-sulfurtransferase ThiI [Methanobacteriaceae archaeon]|nr:tRNA uracil 4-sulfurtransferase ThiI [Methanobacteriaceae archaeon]MDO9627496.1 tRNA uracil 4-sulfurtransferase ThiI [Methanobacteriaceae archaeon]